MACFCMMSAEAAGGAFAACRFDALLHSGLFELAQHRVAALDSSIQRLLGGLLAGERLLDLLRPDVTELNHVAEAQATRVLGRLLVGQLEQWGLEIGLILVEAFFLCLGVSRL